MSIKKLIFITNIPSPYNLDLFESLSKKLCLNVYYYNSIERERQWSLDITSSNYTSYVLKKDPVHHFFQRINRNLYFNFQCIKVAFTTRSDYYVLGGNYFAPNTILLLLILRIRGQKVFWFGERLLPVSSKIKYLVKRILISPINLFTKAIFAVGEGAIVSYKYFGYSKPIYNTPYSINNYRFDSIKSPSSPPQIDKTIFLSSGSLIHRKGYDIALRAFNLLDDQLKNKIEYWILGDGPLRSDLEQIVEHGLTVRFMGFIEPSEIPAYYKNASIFLLTSRYDGWGVVVNEAIAAGLPLIVSKTCGAAEYVNSNNGFIVTDDVNELSAKITYLITHTVKKESFSAYNMQMAKSISSDSIATRLFDHICKF